MSAIIIQRKERTLEKFSDFGELLAKYNDMYRYSVIIGADIVYVVVKETQPSFWEHGWAE